MSMIVKLKDFAKSSLRRADLSLLKSGQHKELLTMADLGRKSQKPGMVDDSHLRSALELLPESTSQLNQDLFVLSELGWKRDGYFVEFGATNGVTFNNTLLLEKRFGWTGILAEPARIWRKGLSTSGRNAKLENDCVWSKTGETLTFNEADWAELSTVSEFEESDTHVRHNTASYQVKTVSLNDMLKRHGAPAVMDYLSIDTEGSELQILEAFDFGTYRFRTITCEHNFTEARERIHALLTSHGYVRKYEEISQFDDWYVHPD